MEILTKDDFETLEQCPWDNAPSDIAEFLYQDDMGGISFDVLSVGLYMPSED